MNTSAGSASSSAPRREQVPNGNPENQRAAGLVQKSEVQLHMRQQRRDTNAHLHDNDRSKGLG